jgi:3-hydroxymyristoyl/3-hydroxydecanoyl-(acyl carrier protein) dehydratase
LPNSIRLHFAADHPALAGHFPGNPIVPGAILLDEVVQAVAAADRRDGPGGFEILAAKFLRPVRPGDWVTIAWRQAASGEIRFECLLADNRPAATGSLRWGVKSP